jgi:hypothetical protein
MDWVPGVVSAPNLIGRVPTAAQFTVVSIKSFPLQKWGGWNRTRVPASSASRHAGACILPSQWLGAPRLVKRLQGRDPDQRQGRTF